MSTAAFAKKLDEVAHPRSLYTKAWVRKQPSWWDSDPAARVAARSAVRGGADFVRGSGMYTGRGGFWGDAWNATSGVRSAIGGWARSQGGITGALGQLSGALGTGDYTTNAIVNGGMGAPEAVPSFTDNTGSSVVISHKEYIADVFGTPGGTSFQNSAYSINPGLETTFPWLAQISQNYDEYSIKQLIFTFRSSIAPIGASGSGQVGTVIMATQYNAGEQPFTDKETMMQYDGAMSAKVIDGLISGVECDPKQSSGSFGKFTRSGPPPVGQDIKTYDLGTFNVAVTNIPEGYQNQSIGELWVSYTIELRKPKFFAARGLGIGGFVTVLPAAAQPWDKNNPFNYLVGDSVAPLPGQLYGQQNSLDIKPYSTGVLALDSLQMGILFGANLSGTYSVVIQAVAQTVGGTIAPILGMTPGVYGNVGFVADTYAATGSTTPTSDWAYAQASYGAMSTFTPNSTPVAYTTYTLRFNVRVAIATNGVNNAVTIAQRFNDGELARIVGWTSVRVQVSEYNSGFNYANNGSNDQVVLVNSGGQVIVPSP